MPGKKKGTTFSLGEFTGGAQPADYIPTTTEELEPIKGQQMAEREARRAAKEANIRKGYYGASGEAGASSSWRMEKEAQPAAPGGAPAAPSGKFAKSTGTWGGAREGRDDAKIFGGSGFGQKDQPKDPYAGFSRSAFGGGKVEQVSPKRDGGRQQKFDPLQPRREKREVVAFARGDMGTAVADSRPAGVVRQTRQPTGPPRTQVVFSRDAMGEKPPAHSSASPKGGDDAPRRWQAGKAASEQIRQRYEERMHAEQEAKEDAARRLRDKMAELNDREPEKQPDAPKPKKAVEPPSRSSWAESMEDEPIHVTIRKPAGEPLGIKCLNVTLRIQSVTPGGVCDRAGIGRYAGTHRLTNVNGRIVTKMQQVREIIEGKTKIVLTLDPTPHETEREEEDEEVVESPARQDEPVHEQPAEEEDDYEDEPVEPEEHFYDKAEEEEPEEELQEEFAEGDKVLLTEDGVRAITEDDAWERVPLKANQVGTIVAWDEADNLPVVRGPDGQEGGLHPVILCRATDEQIAAAAREAEEERRRLEEQRQRNQEAREAAKRHAMAQFGSSLDPTAEPFVPRFGGREERRLDVSGEALTEAQFKARYGRDDLWARAAPASAMAAQEELRLDPHTGSLLTQRQFLGRYGISKAWDQAMRAPQ